MTTHEYWADEQVRFWLSLIYCTSTRRGKLTVPAFVVKELTERQHITRVRKKWHLTDKGAAELVRLTLVLPPRGISPA